MSNDQFTAHRSHFEGLITSFPFQAKEIIDNPFVNQILIWTTASPVWVPEVTVAVNKGTGWSYTGEYIFLLTFEEGESGEHGGRSFKRIERIVEFLDIKGTTRLQELMKAASKNLQVNKVGKQDTTK
ncbi:hypothetical protein IFR05_012216 [Cadophora sp. M221]|nr:hypothetical protein IFR05_012216 [Cadophora sp. M221]